MFHRITRKARQWGGRLYVPLSIGSAAIVAVLIVYFIVREPVHRDIEGQIAPLVVSAPMSLKDPFVAPVVKKVAKWFGLCSVYAATSVAGFKQQVLSDPRLMERYKNFNWDKARIIEIPEDFYSSVLYKKNDKIYWTRKLLRIKKGEKVLTDGEIRIRTYCCNQIALAPPGPFLPPHEEPPPEEIQPPEAPAIPEFPFIPPAIDIPPELFTYVPPSTPPPVERPRFFFPEKRPRGGRIPVAEPETFILIVSGLATLVLLRRRRRK